MPDIEKNIILEQTKSLGSDKKEYCVICKNSYPPGALYCRVCGPPRALEEEPEKGHMTMTQTVLRIAVMALLFSAIVAFKQEISSKLPWLDQTSELQDEFEVIPEDIPVNNSAATHEPELVIVHRIKVGANIRSEPSLVAKKIAVLPEGTQVKILETRETWSRISSGGVNGWVASRLIDKKTEAVE